MNERLIETVNAAQVTSGDVLIECDGEDVRYLAVYNQHRLPMSVKFDVVDANDDGDYDLHEHPTQVLRRLRGVHAHYRLHDGWSVNVEYGIWRYAIVNQPTFGDALTRAIAYLDQKVM